MQSSQMGIEPGKPWSVLPAWWKTEKVKETDGKTQIYLDSKFYQKAKDIKNIYS
jgi:hypothetical protein